MTWEVALRLALAILVLMRDPMLAVPAIIIGLLYIGWHKFTAGSKTPAQST